LSDLYCDIANGFDRKKATIRVANALGTDDLSEISDELINKELKNIYRERAQKRAHIYSNFEKDTEL